MIKRALLLTGVSLVAGVLLTANVAAADPCSAHDIPSLLDALANNTCTTINVAPGHYHPSNTIEIDRPVILNGANAFTNPVTKPRKPESDIETHNGIAVFDIASPDVVLNGFEIDNHSPATGDNGAYGIDIESQASGAVIENDIIEDIIAEGTGDHATAQAIYLKNGSDGVVIADNEIENISGDASTKGVYIGDSDSTDGSNVIIVDGNEIANITSSSRGAYGVTVNNGSQTIGSTQNTLLVVKKNNIHDLTGSWVHAVGIEADAPEAIVDANSFSNLNGTTYPGVAVWFEHEDPSYALSQIHGNAFNFGSNAGVFGIAVDNAITSNRNVDGTCNYWGSATGPGAGTGSAGTKKGALVSALVTFSPWEKKIGGPCSPK